MLRLPISGRRSFRSYIFLVIFACALVAFTLTPESIPDSVGPKPRKTRLPQLLFGYRQAHWSDPPAEPTPSHLEYDVLPESTLSTPRKPQPPLSTHTFRSDGLLEVNPDARHPILDLIDRAEHDWNTKLARASRTLPEAVREYHRRYARAPPPGFDKWQVLLIMSIYSFTPFQTSLIPYSFRV